jgi:hypothetical protein
MHRSLAGLALLCVPLTTSPAAAQKVPAAQFGWHTDYAAARAEARKTGKPIMLVFRCEP